MLDYGTYPNVIRIEKMELEKLPFTMNKRKPQLNPRYLSMCAIRDKMRIDYANP